SLAWGYFDHPPGVAFLGLGTWLAPGSALAGRLGTLVAATLSFLVLASLVIHNMVHSTRNVVLNYWTWACNDHQAKIQAAHHRAVQTLPPGAPQHQTLDLAYLRFRGDLKEDLVCPASGTYLLNIASPTPVVFCSFHGSYVHGIIGKRNPHESFVWWLRYVLGLYTKRQKII
ncbi:MAG TPA: hypothetical protein PKO06_14125, partial [Candidatus Ozemobacteraceae bacterium]|nr:hypothetical protein [Candidatus Ozemobacteraceae bacterium]